MNKVELVAAMARKSSLGMDFSSSGVRSSLTLFLGIQILSFS